MTIIQQDFPLSGIMGCIALLLALFFGILLGSLAATHQNKFSDRLIMVLSTASVLVLASSSLPSSYYSSVFS